MTFDQFLDKLNKNDLFREVKLTENQKTDLIKLIEDHNSKKININSVISLIQKQLILGLDDIYDRYYLVLNTVKPKDSSSKHSFQCKYGEFWETLYNEKLKKSTVTEDSYILKYGEIEGKKKFKELSLSKSMSEGNCIRRHGEIEGKRIYKEFWETTTFGKSEEKFILKYGEIEGKKKFKEYNDSLAGRSSLQYFIDRYGEQEGIEFYNAANKKRSKTQSKETLVETMLTKGCSFEDIEEEIIRRWGVCSLKAFKNRYGEIQGEIEYNLYLKKIKSANPLCLEYYLSRGISEEKANEFICSVQQEKQSKLKRSSKIAYKILFPIATMFVELGLCDTYNIASTDNFEFSIKLNPEERVISGNRIYFYDLFISDLKLIIEYHGERFHDKSINYHEITNTLDNFYDNYNRDLFKKYIAESRGYSVYIIREWELKKDLKRLYHIFNEKYSIGEKWLTLFI